ncbi:MAG TPA: hypothetical protein VNZ49_04680 [Bacteroidia bacterium]|jgi:hypothetical protein|nr:hypothetical protein [Bacteroidia bacterium]
MTKSLSIKLTDFVQQLQSLPVTKLHRLDSILSDLANHVHDIGEYIEALQKEAKGLDSKKKKKELAEITTLKKQLNSVLKLLYKMDYDSHYMDRAQHMSGCVMDNLKGLITELKK